MKQLSKANNLILSLYLFIMLGFFPLFYRYQYADMGDAKAARWMGWRYLQGRGVKKNRKLAEVYFTLAAIQGDPGAKDALKQNFGKTIEATN